MTADKENALNLINLWTIAGILIVNSVTVTLAVIGTMVKDTEDHRLESFYTTPISKGKVALSYILSSIIIGTILCLITFAVAIGYVAYSGGGMLSIATIIKVMLNILLNVCVFSILMFLCAFLIKSSSAWSGFGTIVGTLVGFLGAIYLPMGALPSGVGNVLKFIPILHGTSLMRGLLCEEAIEKTFSGVPQEVVPIFREEMGIDIVIKNQMVSSGIQYCFLAAFGVVALGILLVLVRRQKVNGR